MVMIFLEVLLVFTVSSFEFQQVKLAWLHRQWWMDPNSPDLRHWIIRFVGNAGVLSQAATEVCINSFRVYLL